MSDFDASDNEEGKLPDGESVHLVCFWLTELYLPSSIASLRRGIDEMGWRMGKSRNEDLVEWIDRQRSNTGSWTSLGLVSSSQNPHFMAERTAVLPPGIRAIFPSLHASSGISALTIRFVLSEAASEDINLILKRDFERWTEAVRPNYTYGRSLKSKLALLGWKVLPHWFFSHSQAIHSPLLDRPKAVEDYLRSHRTACSLWMAKRFPGAFNSGEWKSELPSLDLFVTDSARPLDDSSSGIRAFDAVGLARRILVFGSQEWPAIRLALPDTSLSSEPLNLTIACKRVDAFEPGKGWGDDRDDWSIAQYADLRVRGIAFRWAMVQLFEVYPRRLASLRDVVARDARKRTTMSDLKRIRRILSTDAVDLEVASREIKRFAATDYLFRSDLMDFIEVNPRPGRDPGHLSEWWKSGLQEVPDDLVEEMRILVRSLSATSNIKAAMSSIALQRWVIALAAASIAIAIWAAVHSNPEQRPNPKPQPAIHSVHPGVSLGRPDGDRFSAVAPTATLNER